MSLIAQFILVLGLTHFQKTLGKMKSIHGIYNVQVNVILAM
jgi:hypothetical protein